MKTCVFCEYETPARELNRTEDGLVCDTCWDSHELIRNPDTELESAKAKFREFHAYESENSGPFDASLKIPERISCVGESVYVCYRSDKWGDKNQDYIHHNDCRCLHDREAHEDENGPCGKLTCACQTFKSNVKFCLAGGRGESVEVPAFIRKASKLTFLGKCLEYSFLKEDDELVQTKGGKGCELFCVPSGKALLIIKDKKKLVAIVWGGSLAVKDVGIVG